jgi:localization factor PodJL
MQSTPRQRGSRRNWKRCARKCAINWWPRAAISPSGNKPRGRGDAYIGEIAEIRGEIERLTDTIQLLNQRSDERPLNVLRLELEQARAAIESLAREDTVRSIGLRWDDFERRIAAFEDRMAAELRARPQDQSTDALHDRLDQVYAALNSLPDSLPLRALDDKMRKLSGAVEQFVQHQDARQPQSPQCDRDQTRRNFARHRGIRGLFGFRRR